MSIEVRRARAHQQFRSIQRASEIAFISAHCQWNTYTWVLVVCPRMCTCINNNATKRFSSHNIGLPLLVRSQYTHTHTFSFANDSHCDKYFINKWFQYRRTTPKDTKFFFFIYRATNYSSICSFHIVRILYGLASNSIQDFLNERFGFLYLYVFNIWSDFLQIICLVLCSFYLGTKNTENINKFPAPLLIKRAHYLSIIYYLRNRIKYWVISYT